MPNVRVVLEYDGTDYYGFQYQPMLPTIQGTLETCWSRVLGFPIRVQAAGRTDAGVHAEGQVVNFHIGKAYALPYLQQLLRESLPPTIGVRAVDYVPESFHARFSARRRIYRYRIQNRDSPSPLRRRFAAWFGGRLDPGALQEGLQLFQGKHNFWAFCGGGVARDEAQKTILRTAVWQEEEEILMELEGYSFLPRMVRMIVAACVRLARGQTTTEEIQQYLHSPPRKFPHVAPPEGLCLYRVIYEEGTP